MKVLLDECVDRRLARDLVGYEVSTVAQMGWAGCRNGHLLTLAVSRFDVLLTVDRNLSTQQNLSAYEIAVVVLRSHSNRLTDLRKLIPQLLVALLLAPKGAATVVEWQPETDE